MQEAKSKFLNLHPDEQPRSLKEMLQTGNLTPKEIGILLAEKGNYTTNGFFALVWNNQWQLIDQLMTMGVEFGPQHFFVAYVERPLQTGLYYLFLKNQNALLRKLVKPGMLEYIFWNNFPLRDFILHLRKEGDEDSVAFWKLCIPSKKFQNINSALSSSYSVELNCFLKNCDENLQKYVTVSLHLIYNICLPDNVVTQIIIAYMMGEFSEEWAVPPDLEQKISSTQGICEHTLIEAKKHKSMTIEQLANQIITKYKSNYHFGDSPPIDQAYLRTICNHIVYFLDHMIEFSKIADFNFQKKLTDFFVDIAKKGILLERNSLLEKLCEDHKINPSLKSFDYKAVFKSFRESEDFIDRSCLLYFKVITQMDSKDFIYPIMNSDVMEIDDPIEMLAPKEFAQLDFEKQKLFLVSHFDKITFDHLFFESKTSPEINNETCLDRLSEHNEWALLKQLVDRKILRLEHFGHSRRRRPEKVWCKLFSSCQNDILKTLYDLSPYPVNIYDWPLAARGFLAQVAKSGNETLFKYWHDKVQSYHVHGGVDYQNKDEQWILAFKRKIDHKEERPERLQNHIKVLTELLTQCYSDHFDNRSGCPGKFYLNALGQWLLTILSSIEVSIYLSKHQLKENLFNFFKESAKNRVKFTEDSLKKNCMLLACAL